MTHNESRDADYEVRQARASDTRDVAQLWCDAFPGSRTVEERMAMLQSGGRYGGLETVLVLRGGGGALVGAAKLYRLEGHVAGEAFPLMGLAAVAIASEHRRRGLGERLCHEAIHAAAARGDLASALYPFRPEYYRRLGWGQVGALHDHRFHTRALPRYSEESRHVRPAGPSDTDAIAACYARVAERSNGPISRDARIWAYRLAAEELGVRLLSQERSAPFAGNPKLRAVVFDENGITGYALLRHSSDRASARRALVVRELVAETEHAYRGLLGYVAAQHEGWPVARHFARPHERFADRLSDPRPPGHGKVRSLYFPTARIVQGPMFRLLDVAAALRLRPWFNADPPAPMGAAAGRPDPRDGVLRITVADAQLPTNTGPWTVRLRGQGTGAIVEAGDGGTTGDPARPEASLSTDAPTFARIFVGEIPPTEAVRLGSASIAGDGRLLDAAFATRERFWLLDEF